MEPFKEFVGLLRVVRVEDRKHGLFRATCTLVNDAGNIIDNSTLHYVDSSYSTIGCFVEVGQLWEIISGVSISGSVELASGHTRPTETVDPYDCVLRRPSGKHLIWHFTKFDWYPGIGKGKIESLLDTLGGKAGFDDLFEAIENSDVDALCKAPLISQWDAEIIIEGWKNYGNTLALKWFETKQIDTSVAKKIYQHYGANTIELLDKDPYRLSAFGIPWQKVDSIAKQHFSVQSTDERRLASGATEVLWESYHEHGNTKVGSLEFLKALKEKLNVENDDLMNAVMQTLDNSRAFVRGEYIHHYEASVMEMTVARRISDLLYEKKPPRLPAVEMDEVIAKFEREESLQLGIDFELTSQQKLAIKTSINNGFSIITGGAGVGKTTVLKALYALYDAAGYKRKQMALAGRAAQRMTEATGEESQTISGYLHHDETWQEISENDCQNWVVVIDEGSMVDIHSMYKVLEKTPKRVQFLLIGDPYQLPPVGGGLVLHELVDRDYLPVSELSVVKRQGEDSSIPRVAGLIRQGEVPAELGENVEFSKVDKNDLAERAIAEYLKNRDCSQILCATNALVKAVNAKAQALLNPDGKEVEYVLEEQRYGTGIRLNDPVLCTSNLYTKEYDLRNGSLGSIIELYDGPRTFKVTVGSVNKKRKARKDKNGKASTPKPKTKLEVSYGRVKWDDGSRNGLITELPFDVIASLKLAYGITVHKSQGSQFKHAIFAVVQTTGLDRTLVYTAITRASEHAVVLGDLRAVERAIVEPPSAARRLVGLGQFFDSIHVG